MSLSIILWKYNFSIEIEYKKTDGCGLELAVFVGPVYMNYENMVLELSYDYNIFTEVFHHYNHPSKQAYQHIIIWLKLGRAIGHFSNI